MPKVGSVDPLWGFALATVLIVLVVLAAAPSALAQSGIVPDAPTGLTATPGDGQVSLSWTAGDDDRSTIIKHQYQHYQGGIAGPWTDIPDSGAGGTNAAGYTVEDLTSGPYHFRVRAVNAIGEGHASGWEADTPNLMPEVWSATLAVQDLGGWGLGCDYAPTIDKPCSQSSILTDDDFTYDNVDYAVMSLGLTSRLEIGVDNRITSNARNKLTLHVDGAAFAFKDADSDTNSYRRRWSSTGLSWSEGGSVSLRITGPPTAPGSPTDLAATAGDRQATLSWTAGDDGHNPITKHQYQRMDVSGQFGSWTDIPDSGASGANAASYTVTGLNATPHKFRVRAANAIGNGAASNEALVTSIVVREVWSATLTVQDLGNNQLGCDNDSSSGRHCNESSGLTNNGFTYEETAYAVTHLVLSAATGNLSIVVDQSITPSSDNDFILHVDGAAFPFEDADTKSSTGWAWNNSGLSWSADSSVSLSITTPVTAAELPMNGSVSGTLNPEGDIDYFRVEITEPDGQYVLIKKDNYRNGEGDNFIYLTLWKEDGSCAVRECEAPVEGRYHWYFLEPGTYFLRAVANDEQDDVSQVYSISLEPFTWLHDEIERCSAIETDFDDPLFGCQWHLHNTGQYQSDLTDIGALDINVMPAWNDGYMGQGINVAIVDNGMDFEHEDLRDNVDRGRNHDYRGMGTVFDPNEDHGTQMAGIIAARDNSVGGVGVAPRATIYSYNCLNNLIGRCSQEPDALTRNLADTAVSNHSYGSLLDPEGGHSRAAASWEEAVETGIRDGFGGKGIVYVTGSGNHGWAYNYHTNLDEQKNFYAFMTVGATNSHGIRQSYSNQGYSLWLSAPVWSLNTGNYDTYTMTEGTSMASAVVSGVAALVRSANTNLTWRDVKLILAASAQKNDPDNSSWEDGALKYGSETDRYNYNPEYGFGVVDAGEAVALAKQWANLPPMKTTSADTGDKRNQFLIADRPESGRLIPTVLQLTLGPEVGFAEFVEVRLDGIFREFRDLRIELESPSGTVSVLGTPSEYPGSRDMDFIAEGIRWGSARHLGEDPTGVWTLKITDEVGGSNDRSGTIHGWSIKVYGHGEGQEPTPPKYTKVPDTPQTPTVVAIHDGIVDLEWNNVPETESYEVQFYDYGWLDLPGRGIEIALYGAGAVVRNLDPDGWYPFHVRAKNPLGTSDWSDIAYFQGTGSQDWNGVPEPTNSPATGAPTISGTPQVGEELTASVEDIEDANGLNRVKFSYQWIRSNGSTDTDIEGATDAAYTLTDGDEGKTIKVRVSFTDRGGYAESLTSAATAAVTNNAPASNTPATGLPTLGGTAQVGETLTAETRDIEDDDGLDNAVFTYQWLANGADIAGATDPTYTLVDDDAGLTIKVQVSFFDDKNNPETLTSAATTAVLANVPDTPEHLNVSLRDTGALDVSWEAPSTDGGSAITEYRVQWKETAGSWDTPADVTEETATGTTHTITGLTDGVEYAVRIIAVNDIGDGPPSDEATGTPRDTTSPTVTSLQWLHSTDGTDDIYTIGDELYAWVEFSEWVSNRHGEGTPRLRINLEDDKHGYGQWDTSWGEYNFIYRVTEGVMQSQGVSTGANPIELNGGDIEDAAGNDAILDHPGIPANREFVIDGVRPKVESLAITSDPGEDKTYGVGDVIEVSVTFSEDVRVPSLRGIIEGEYGEWFPVLTLQIGNQKETADFFEVNYTVVKFTYTVAVGDSASNGIAIPQNALSFNNGILEDDVGTRLGSSNAANLDHSALTADSGHIVHAPARQGGLRLLELSGIPLAFDPAIDNYSAHVANEVMETTVTATANDHGATYVVQLGGVTDNDRTVSLAVGENVITIEVTAEDDTKTRTYTITVTRSSNTPATGAPTVTGTAQVGETLTADISGIGDDDGLPAESEFDYQWIAGTTDISGATGSSYTPLVADLGKTIKVRVSFDDDQNNFESLTSAATAAVLANVPGAPEHLNVSLHDTGALDVSWEAPATDGGSAITDYRVQWKETAGNWDTPADVTEETATGTTHTITGLTDGVGYAVRIIAVNDAGDGPPSSEATGTPRETTPPELSTATVDSATLTLTYDEDLDENSEPSSDAFSVTVGGTGRAVDGVSVSGSSVILTLGSAVASGATVTVSYAVPTDAAAPRIQDDAGNPAASFSDQDVENNTPPPANTPATGAPTITGTAQVGDTLTADISGIGDDDGLPAESEFSYQWIAGTTDISGATGSTYTLVDADAGLTIQVKVSFFDDKNNPETLTSAATAAVEEAAPAPGPITGFTVVDASDQSVEGTLADGGTLALDDPVGGSFGIRADLESGATIGSMRLELTGEKTHAQTENIAPYSLYGDSGGNLSGESLPVGEYTLTATAYSEARLGGDLLGTLKVSFSVTGPATQQPNTPATGLPTISGIAQVGETLRADISGIADVDGMSGAVFSYQWLANEVNIDTDIAGATDPTYTLVADDVGKAIRVRVSFMDGASNVETLTSEATATVVTPLTAGFQDAPDKHLGTGFFTFEIAFSEPISISYKTLRDDSLEVTNGSATKAKRMDGQSDRWEITVEPDSDADVTVVLPITEGCESDGAVCTRDGTELSNRSELTVPGPAAANSPATGAPSISGTAQVGETLTVDTSGIDDADGMSGAVFSYQWLADGVDIAGATNNTYTLVDTDVGKTIKVRVIFRDDKNNPETLTSEATAAVEPRPNSPATGAPTISGTVRVGETLTVDTSGIDDADGMSGAVFSYQWLADDADIAGATSDTYTLVDADLDKAVKVRVIFTDNADNEETLTSEATAAVEPRPNSPATGSPTISGTAQVGETLTASTSGIDDADGMSGAVFSYQWLANGADVTGATGNTYTPVAGDAGKAIKVRGTFRDDRNHQESLTSAATAAVTAAADDSSIWSATLTVGSSGSFHGYWKDLMGSLAPEGFNIDGSDYTVTSLNRYGDLMFAFVLDQALPGDFTLQVGDTTFRSEEAEVNTSSSSYSYLWQNKIPDLSDGDIVEVSLTASD